MDGVRGIAILLVVACHTFYANPDGPQVEKLIAYIIGAGSIGVQIFFSLSGFVISYSFFLRKAEGRKEWLPTGYFARRFWRIYPPLILSMVFFCIFYQLTMGDAMIREACWWLIGWPHIAPVEMHFNPAVWSLVIEVQFYLVLPILFWSTRRLSYPKTVLVIFTVLLCAPLLTRQIGWVEDPSRLEWQLMLRRFPGYLDSFAWGVLAAGLFAWERVHGIVALKRSRLAWVGWPLLAVTMAILGCDGFFYDSVHTHSRWGVEIMNALPTVATFCLLQYVQAPGMLGARLLSISALRWFGLVSYEWYLFHQPIIYWFREVAGSAHGNILRYLAILAVPVCGTLVVGVVLYRFVSLPILRAHRGTKPRHG